jgi:hypothetical protein
MPNPRHPHELTAPRSDEISRGDRVNKPAVVGAAVAVTAAPWIAAMVIGGVPGGPVTTTALAAAAVLSLVGGLAAWVRRAVSRS